MADGKPIPEVIDTTTREYYRSFLNIRDSGKFKEAKDALELAFARMPKNPELLREFLRLHLSVEQINWGFVAQLCRSILELDANDSRANYMLARVEFEQYDDGNKPTASERKDPERVLKSRDYLEASKKSAVYPIWRTLELEVLMTRWLLAQPPEKRCGIDEQKESARVRELLFDPKTGALARAANREGFDGLSRLDVIGIINIHQAAIEVAAEDARKAPTGPQLILHSALKSLLSIARVLAEDPKNILLAGEVIEVLTATSVAAQPEAERSMPAEWDTFARSLEAFCKKAVESKTCRASASIRLAEIHQVDADKAAARNDPAAVAAVERKALEWYDEAARWPKMSDEMRVDVNARALELKTSTAGPVAVMEPNLTALRGLKGPKAKAAAAFFAGAAAVRVGRLTEALGHLNEAAGVENGGEFVLRAFAALPALALQTGKYREAANFARDLDKGWDNLAGFSRHGKAWVAQFVGNRDELSAIAASAQFALARQRVERELKDRPGKPLAADLTQSIEKAADAAMQKIKGKGGPNMIARLAQLEFLTVVGRSADAKAALDALNADYPNSADVLRVEITNVEARKAADARARIASEASKLFWAEWLASTGRTTEAIAGLDKGFATLVNGAKDPTAAAALIRAFGSAADSNDLTANRTMYARVREGVKSFGDTQMDMAARAFRSAAEAAPTRFAAADGLRQSLAALEKSDPNRGALLREELKLP
jgi:hypothetical protein